MAISLIIEEEKFATIHILDPFTKVFSSKPTGTSKIGSCALYLGYETMSTLMHNNGCFVDNRNHLLFMSMLEREVEQTKVYCVVAICVSDIGNYTIHLMSPVQASP